MGFIIIIKISSFGFKPQIWHTFLRNLHIIYKNINFNLFLEKFETRKIAHGSFCFKDVNFFTTPVDQKILSWCSILLEISALHLHKCIKYKYTSCVWHKNEKFIHMECIRTCYGELFVLP